MLILLYADARGDLKVVLTERAKTLSSCGYLISGLVDLERISDQDALALR